MLYLDNAATTLIKPRAVSGEMLRALTTAASPGRGGHVAAMTAASIVYRCREAVAEMFNVPSPEQVVFTQNATHALNIAINSLAKKGDKVLVSGYEHNSVTRPLEAINCEIIIAESALFDQGAMIHEFAEKIKNVDLVVCTHVSNVFGYILPIYEIAEICRKNGVPFIVDASQSAGALPVDFQKLGARFIAMPGHKALFGPQGTGILLCAENGKVLISGGSGSDSRKQRMPDFLPDRHEAGTHNVPGIAGLFAGINYVSACGIDNIRAYEEKLIKEIAEELTRIDGIEVFYAGNNTQCGVLSFRTAFVSCDEIGRLLSEEGVCVRSGLHCSPYAHRSAGTLETGTVRLSVSPFVTLENAHDFCRMLQKLLKSND